MVRCPEIGVAKIAPVLIYSTGMCLFWKAIILGPPMETPQMSRMEMVGLTHGELQEHLEEVGWGPNGPQNGKVP